MEILCAICIFWQLAGYEDHYGIFCSIFYGCIPIYGNRSFLYNKRGIKIGAISYCQQIFNFLFLCRHMCTIGFAENTCAKYKAAAFDEYQEVDDCKVYPWKNSLICF